MSDDPYRVLGVGRDASADEIRAAFRRRIREDHPDRTGQGDGAAARAVVEAYRTLAGLDPQVAPPRPRAQCATCSGRGTVWRQMPCPVCGGTGAITDLAHRPAREITCPRCSGRRSVRAALACPTCGDAGVHAAP